MSTDDDIRAVQMETAKLDLEAAKLRLNAAQMDERAALERLKAAQPMLTVYPGDHLRFDRQRCVLEKVSDDEHPNLKQSSGLSLEEIFEPSL